MTFLYLTGPKYILASEQKDVQKQLAKSFTPEIGKLRKELMLCQKIEERSLGINKFLNEHEKQKRRKERTR